MMQGLKTSPAWVPPAARLRGMMGFPSERQADPQKAWLEGMDCEKARSRERTLYLHIPFCKSRCHFCPFYMGGGSWDEVKGYVRMLVKELETASANGLGDLLVNAVYFGGGTPSDLEPEDFESLLTTLRSHYRLANDCEITIEGRVTGFSEDKMKSCIENGVNRFSIGVQSFDTDLRRSIGRRADRDEVIGVLDKLSSFGQSAVVIDLLYGLPGQSMGTWMEDLRTAVEDVKISGLDHYNFNVHRGLPVVKMIEDGRLPPCPDAEVRFKMYKAGEDAMSDAGALRLSVKHFAFDWRERNANNDIASRKSSCLPFGVHSGGRLGAFMFRQTDTLKSYASMVEDGAKPLDYAGRVPDDYEVCSRMAGQISRRLAVNIGEAAAADPARAERIVMSCSPLLERWAAEGLVHESRPGWIKFGSEALFNHKAIASELMEAVACAYKGCTA